MQIGTREIDSVCELVHELCGIYLDASKSYLIESRLGELVRRHECTSFGELVQRAGRGGAQELKSEIVDAITTQETLFFRNQSPFEALKYKALPELIDSKQRSPFPRRIRIWSAATSTGQEAYSIAMSLCEVIPDIEKWDIQILGTDISDAAIAKASRGQYSPLEVERGVPDPLLRRYFRRVEKDWTVHDRVRSLVSFRRLNLHESFDALGRFDIIFCRNVAIYFTPKARRSLFDRMTKKLATTGYLFVGSSELLRDLGAQYVPLHHCGAVFYRPNLEGAKV